MPGRDAKVQVHAKSRRDFTWSENVIHLKWPGHVLLVAVFALASTGVARAQPQAPANAESALSDALAAACRQDSEAFAKSLTAENTTAFRALPGPQRTAIM